MIIRTKDCIEVRRKYKIEIRRDDKNEETR